MARSSACKVLETCQGSTVLMFLMYRRKNVDGMTPLCGTPCISTLLLKCPSSFTLADLSSRKHRIHLYILPETPLSSIFVRRPSCQTLSKVFIRLKKTETIFFFSWKAFSVFWVMRASWSSVLPISILGWWQYFLFFHFQKWYQSSVDHLLWKFDHSL